MNISKSVNLFLGQRDLKHRYSSFDFCYNYFYKNKNNILEDIEKSCAILGFYLASWGMMRGSSFLLQKSYNYYIPLIKYISSLDSSIWDIDVSNYENNYSVILQIYKDISEIIIEDNQRGIVLITKIMLGVLGICPAYDEYFCKAFKKIDPNKSKFTTFNKKSLEVISNFYKKNKSEIDDLNNQIRTLNFMTGEELYNYKLAKIIDMYGFTSTFHQ